MRYKGFGGLGRNASMGMYHDSYLASQDLHVLQDFLFGDVLLQHRDSELRNTSVLDLEDITVPAIANFLLDPH